jgi:DNA-binding response OmpR family regulator
MKPAQFIVIVEDEPMLRDIATERFRHAGYQVKSFSNGLDMLAEISDLQPSAIILDVMTPEIDGFGVLESIKKNFSERRFEHVPIVIWSNLADQDSINRALRLGATEYLKKIDYTGDELVGKIRQILN